ncbi:AAA family ATPase [Methylococcus mesophilus]|uniref:AAA family ATPase n=1 Tax=Methylococcus mesophilus TaxID=2993564 RepID=UPI00224AE481|nr:AAA family ATPase [Methylococcus mesophilus]UZR29777.1 AAA family ATPase [Methylococcus mesophilus]
MRATAERRLDDLADQLAGSAPVDPPPPEALRLTEEEISAATLSPRCIVQDYLYADVATLIAPGGTGKTTILLHEAVSIALGRDVWGMVTRAPGWTLIVTAEDPREALAARLREIMDAMELQPPERRIVLDRVRVWDVTGLDVRLVHAAGGSIFAGGLVDRIVNAYRDDPPVMVVFDPLVSFGASEESVNTNEQALITAARRIVRGLGCCVRLVHHTGKAVARDRTLDQYAGRGGSALADGARMVAVLQPYALERGGTHRPPPTLRHEPDTNIVALARPKLSYAKPNLPIIWIKRAGYAFEHAIETKAAPEQVRKAEAEQLERFLVSELARDRRHSKATLDAAFGSIALSRSAGRTALAELLVSGRAVEAELPNERRQGGRKTYLHPVAYPANTNGEVHTESSIAKESTSPLSTSPPPYRKENGGEVDAANSFPCSSTPPHEIGEVRRG